VAVEVDVGVIVVIEVEVEVGGLPVGGAEVVEVAVEEVVALLVDVLVEVVVKVEVLDEVVVVVEVLDEVVVVVALAVAGGAAASGGLDFFFELETTAIIPPMAPTPRSPAIPMAAASPLFKCVESIAPKFFFDSATAAALLSKEAAETCKLLCSC
jgi:hypothetical protein